MGDGWCPFATQHRGRGEGPFGYPAGARGQNRPVAFVDHRMGGWKRTLDNDIWRHDNWVGVHAGIGFDGSLDQYTSIFDASWGNGISGSIQKYDRSNRHLADWELRGMWISVQYAGTTAYALVAGGVNIPNSRTISTEHEDGNRDAPWPQAMIDTTIRWKRWCNEELAAAGKPIIVIDADALIGHFQIDAVNRPGCPGDNWPKAEILRGLQPVEDDDMKPYLAWCPERTATYFIGPQGARWITDGGTVAQLEAAFGKMAVTHSAAVIDALGVV